MKLDPNGSHRRTCSNHVKAKASLEMASFNFQDILLVRTSAPSNLKEKKRKEKKRK
jgi:hypothetical protein